MNMLDNMIKYNEEKEEEATEVKNKENNKEKKEELSFNNNLLGINDIITNNQNNYNNNKENNIDENNNVDNIKENNTKEHNIDNDNIYNYNYNNQNVIYHDNNINYNFNSKENNNNYNNNIYGTNLNSNINNINYNNVNTMNMNNYMNNNINNNQNIENDIPQEKGEEKDIIDELIEKIRTNQQITNRESSKESLNRLDEEIKLGLERLNELFPSQRNCFDTKDKDKDNNKNRINKMKVSNRRFTDLLHEINKTLNETNNKAYYNKRNNYYDYKNVKIIKPKVYFQSESRQPIYGKNLSHRNNLYMSSIDGKIIVNGQRKNLFDSSNLENIYKNTGNNFYRMKTSLDFNTDRNFINLNRRRNNSIDRLSSNFGYKKRNPSLNIRSTNRFNKDYFMDELNKIQNLLFSDIRRGNKYY